jgi:hypothetical protein
MVLYALPAKTDLTGMDLVALFVIMDNYGVQLKAYVNVPLVSNGMEQHV